MYFFFSLPFVHLLPYLWFDYAAPRPDVMWGLASNPYMVDPTIIGLTGMIGAVGVCGLVWGCLWSPGQFTIRSLTSELSSGRVPRTTPILVFVVLVGLAITLSWLAAPALTIFEAKYTDSATLSENWNFGSAWLVSYGVLIFCLADTFSEPRRNRMWIKLSIALIALAYIVIWLQFFRGDRECIPLVLACAVLVYYWGASSISEKPFARIVLRIAAVGIFVLVVVSGAMLQELRSRLVGKSLWDVSSTAQQAFQPSSKMSETGSQARPDHSVPGYANTESANTKSADTKSTDTKEVTTPHSTVSETFADALKRIKIPSGTWSAVLLTPLSVAGDSLHGSLPLRLGRTYWELLFLRFRDL